MTTLEDRTRTALLVVDVQQGVVAGTFDRDRVVANVARLVDRARGEGVPVVWVQDDAPGERGSTAWQLVDELVPVDAETRIFKHYPDAFEDTGLESALAEYGVGRLVVCGAQTDQCVRATLHGAVTRGYDAILVADAHTTEDLTAYGSPSPDLVVAHTNLYWSGHEAPGRTADVVTTDEASFT